jgi:hypothetical protein
VPAILDRWQAAGTITYQGHLAQDLAHQWTTPRFAFITPNLCDDGHDATCAGTNDAGGMTGGLVGADDFLRTWMPLILNSPAYRRRLRGPHLLRPARHQVRRRGRARPPRLRGHGD